MISYDQQADLLSFQPTGTLDLPQIREYYDVVARHKPEGCTRRFVNLDTLDLIGFGFDDISNISVMAEKSRSRAEPLIKIALLATKPSSLATANMVAKLMGKSDYVIQVCSNTEQAAGFLGVSPDLLSGD